MKLRDHIYETFMWRVVHPLVMRLCEKIQPSGLCTGFPTSIPHDTPRCPKHGYPLMDGVCRVCAIDQSEGERLCICGHARRLHVGSPRMWCGGPCSACRDCAMYHEAPAKGTT